MNYEAFCERCKHYSFNIKHGILCGLTNEKPAFNTECDKFVLDPAKDKPIKRTYFMSDNTDTTEQESDSGTSGNFRKFLQSIAFILCIVVPIFAFSKADESNGVSKEEAIPIVISIVIGIIIGSLSTIGEKKKEDQK